MILVVVMVVFVVAVVVVIVLVAVAVVLVAIGVVVAIVDASVDVVIVVVVVVVIFFVILLLPSSLPLQPLLSVATVTHLCNIYSNPDLWRQKHSLSVPSLTFAQLSFSAQINQRVQTFGWKRIQPLLVATKS